ncbi:site-specific integrase [Bradyrhizobium sp. LA7.1]|uniref:site-specific integrase n=1 Tax=Bradyrhizobium sp. LA7.1 TaxID=3156324 RepID=UPI003398191F
MAQTPCAGVHRPETPKARDRVLSDAEILEFWTAVDAEPTVFAAPLKLLLLTGCRLNEVSGLRLAELSGDQRVWIIPKERTKNRRAHTVPLSRLAQKILRSALDEGFSSSLAFSTTGAAPVSGWSKVKARLDTRMNVAPWRLHDLRRTAATGMAEIGVQPHIIEAVLNHVSGARAGVAGVYNRALYSTEKAEALEKWAQYIERAVQGSAKVVSLTRRNL